MDDADLPDPGLTDPSFTADMDQAQRGLADMAKLVGSYFDSLRAEGFERDEALVLAVNYQDNFLKGTGE